MYYVFFYLFIYLIIFSAVNKANDYVEFNKKKGDGLFLQ